MDAEASTLGFVNALVRGTRPEILFVFSSAESAARFLEEAVVFNVAALIASGRLKCVLDSRREMTLRLVKSDGSGGWRVLGASFSPLCTISGCCPLTGANSC